MARTTSLHVKASTKRLAVGFVTFWFLCAKHTRRVVKKLCPDRTQFRFCLSFPNERRGKAVKDGFDDEREYGLWQKSILMGDKCEPLDFSGVICYDSNGKKLDEMPVKSPRTSPLPPGYFFHSAARRENEF